MIYEHNHSLGNQAFHVYPIGKDRFEFAQHLHRSFELVCVTDGQMNIEIAGTTFTVKSGQGAIVVPGQPHGYSSPDGESEHFVCIFSGDNVPAFDKYCRMGKLHHPVFEVGDIVSHSLYSEAVGRPFMIKALLYRLAEQYCRGERYDGFDLKTDDLIYDLIGYLESNFTKPISLTDVATRFGYSYNYISGVINRFFKASFSQVVNRYRIDYACRLLKEDEVSISQISDLCGYDSQRNFNRCFKSLMGMTPREFKQQL